ncbi:type II secretion system protein [Idiomarina sp. Sol25]|uniref:PilW family protein n=1 Tax=Idiomarina sp. Sol25 TaxID=3064000 RepID=UPI00294AF21F|nr:type II secretion system protein [Idiomarina sp. Sol25]MDV6327879.1 type II secretion system protein [Idiomarina sp. Sol25]
MSVQRGFTLIELVIVIVLLAIVAGFSFQFVGIGAQMFSTGSERLQTIEKSRFAIERLTREIRGAVPNSVRVSENKQCIEFVPIIVAGTYYNAPIQSDSGSEMTLVTFADSPDDINGNERVFIYATRPNFIYADSGRNADIQSYEKTNNIEFELTFNEEIRFAKESPLKRAYIGSTPVSFCLDSGNLFRVSSYGWGQAQTEWSSGDLIATGVSSDEPFDVTANNQQSNNIVTIQLQFGDNAEEQVFYYREVHIPNAP